MLAKTYQEAPQTNLPWAKRGKAASPPHDKDLLALADVGVAYHHAGLDFHDRRYVEDGFINGSICIVGGQFPASRRGLYSSVPPHSRDLDFGGRSQPPGEDGQCTALASQPMILCRRLVPRSSSRERPSTRMGPSSTTAMPTLSKSVRSFVSRS